MKKHGELLPYDLAAYEEALKDYKPKKKMVRVWIYGIMAALFLGSGIWFGFGEIWPFLLWALPLIAAGEIGAWYKRRKHRNDK